MSRNLFFGITSRVLMLIAASLTFLSIASMFVNPARFWIASVLGLLFVPLTILDFILLIWACKRKSKSFVIPLAALLPSVFFLGLYVRIPLNFNDTGAAEAQVEVNQVKASRRKGDTLKVISYNVGRFRLFDEDCNVADASACVDSICDFIRRESPDIVCLQEVYMKQSQTVRNLILPKLWGYNAEYYFFKTAKGYSGNLTLSRYPVMGKGKIKFDESTNLALYTDYGIMGRQFRIYNCHFESYNISFTGIVRSLFEPDSDVLVQTGGKMKRSMTRRPKQVDKVFSHIEDCQMESFVCGDFNDNPMSYTYYRMSRDRKDAFVDAGRWFGATFSLLWPMLRIDYILYPDKYEAEEYAVPHIGFSDHYPVVTKINLGTFGK